MPKALNFDELPSHPEEPASKKPVSHRKGTNAFVAGKGGGKKGKGGGGSKVIKK